MRDLLTADVPDPTDFPPHDVAPGLRLLDEALRCNVCHELYDAPVTLNCGHCFCSLCIRNYLKEKEECPTCRKPASDMHLRKNVALENAVKAWAAAREFALRLAKLELDRISRGRDDEPNGGHPRPRKRPRLEKSNSGGSSSDEVEIVDGPVALTSRHFSSSIKKQRSNHSPRTPDTPDIPSPGSSEGLVDCPMCQRRVPFGIINKHLDSNCTVIQSTTPKPRGTAKQEWSKILGGTGAPRRQKDKERLRSPSSQPDDEPEYLPTVSYHTLKDRRLQELLHRHGLPATGDRSAWVRRHGQWVTLHNANLDRAPADRRKPGQLRRDLARWEAAEGSASAGGKKRAGEVRDAVAYQAAHKAEFARLVEAARPKKKAAVTAESAAGERGSELEVVVDGEEVSSSPDS